jgi:hypothetical protein
MTAAAKRFQDWNKAEKIRGVAAANGDASGVRAFEIMNSPRPPVLVMYRLNQLSQ